MPSENNKRIAKNTLFLYFRMGITMLVSLYASRVILKVLGVADYGLYNVVGGIVTLFAFLNQSLSTATQRYLSFELGRQNYSRLKEIFSTSIIIYGIVALIVLFLAETIGLWFLNTQMNFPADRKIAANWVYQFSILATCVNIFRAPFGANIIANERMSFFAYTSIMEAVLKLVILYILVILPFDKLIVYSILIFLIVVSITVWYYFYNKKHFSYISLVNEKKNKALFKELVNFSGWGIFGSIASVGFRQGINVLINIFFGVTVNAAFGIANSVSNMVNQFVYGLQVALNPQLTKTYAAGDVINRDKLIFRSAKFSYYLLLLIGLPVLLNTKFLLKIWLETVPDYTVLFTQLMIIAAMVDALSAPLWVIIFATGKIKTYQIVISSVVLCNVLFSYIAAKLGMGPEYMLYIRIIIFALCIGIRLSFVQKYISFKISDFVKKVLFPVLGITILTVPLSLYTNTLKTEWGGLIISSAVSSILSIVFIYLIGMDKGERFFVSNLIKNRIKRL